MSENEIPNIPDFFAGRNIFITGGTGFMGKVLIEKLLRSCPDIGKIYMLVRPKKDKTPQERIKIMTDLPLFIPLKEQNPKAIEKIVPILGDVVELGLGLSDKDRQLLIQSVSIIYHAAASVRFDDHLTDAIIMNTRGTREIVNLALEMNNLVALMHVSTTYCLTDRKEIGEQLYPPHTDWRDAIRLAEEVDRHTMDIVTAKYISPLPNTYTFTKSLGEHVVNDLCTGQIPAIIFRPSIVISTMKEPVSGWIDNFNGPVALLIASGKGIVRSVYSDPKLIADYVPVDIVAKAMIIATWRKGINTNPKEKFELSFYNGSSNRIEYLTMGELVEMGKKICWDYPVDTMLWYPGGNVTNCWYYHYFRVLFYHMLPAFFVDLILRIVGHKPFLFKIQRKIYIANMALQYFITNEWFFQNDNTSNLEYKLLPSDVNDFGYDRDNIDVYGYFVNGTIGGKKYLLKEDIANLEKAKINSRRMWMLAQVCNFMWYVAIVWLLFFKINIFNYTVNKFYDFHEYLNTE